MQLGGGEGGGGGTSGAGASYRTLRSRRSAQVLGEINVTPFVDVVLVLLLVFMVTAPLMSRGIDIDLPVATQTDKLPEDRVTVSIKADGHIYVGDRPMNALALEDHLRGLVSSGASAKIAYLRADEKLPYGKVVEVIDIIKRAGIETVGLAYSLPNEKRK